MARANGTVQGWGRAVTVDEAVACEAPVLRVCGPVASGKTEFIVRKAASLVVGGTEPAKVLCVVNTAAAAKRLAERLAVAGCEGARVETPLSLCLGVLECAQAATGRAARVLGVAEYNMLLEDLKASGADAAALRRTLAKVFAGQAAVAPREAWGLDAAENTIYDNMQERLAFLNARLREEVPALAAQYLASEAGAELRGSFACVLVDDAQNLSPATLQVCRALATDFFAACGNPNQFQAGFDAGATAAAFEALATDAECLQLGTGVQPAPIARFCDALCTADAMDATLTTGVQTDIAPSPDVFACIKWREPDDEFKGIGAIIREAVTAERSFDPGDVFVLVPNRAWASGVVQGIRSRNMDAVVALGANPVAGDPRNAARLGTLEAYCRLALAADATDAPVWRLWAGLGRTDCACAAWETLRLWAAPQNLSAAEALAALAARDDDPFEDAADLRKRYADGLAAAETLGRHTGFQLLKNLEAFPGGRELGVALDPIQGDETALQLRVRLVAMSLTPYFTPDPRRVTVGTYRQIQGLDPKLVIVAGCIDGFVPAVPHTLLDAADPAAQAKVDAERRAFYNGAGKARRRLVLSYAQRADADLAAKLKMDARRVKNEHGRRVAVFSRSCFVEQAGNAASGTLSGEQFLADE